MADAKQVAREILSECAAKFATPWRWDASDPGRVVDQAVENAAALLRPHLEPSVQLGPAMEIGPQVATVGTAGLYHQPSTSSSSPAPKRVWPYCEHGNNWSWHNQGKCPSPSEGARMLPPEFYEPVSKERAHLALTRYMNLQFNKQGERPCARIPADPDDDDIVLARFIDAHSLSQSTTTTQEAFAKWWLDSDDPRMVWTEDGCPADDDLLDVWEAFKAGAAFSNGTATMEIDRLAKFISENFPNEPGRTGESESAVDVAMRLMRQPNVEPLVKAVKKLMEWEFSDPTRTNDYRKAFENVRGALASFEKENRGGKG